MHGSTMVYLFVVPVALAAGLYLVPLQVGAAEIAGPRVALAGLWLLISGGITMWCGFLTSGGAAQASWWGFDPLSSVPYSPGAGMDLWIYGVAMATVAVMLWSGCVIATALWRRAPGMTLMRMPVFTWTMVVTCLMVLFAFPALLVALGLAVGAAPRRRRARRQRRRGRLPGAVLVLRPPGRLRHVLPVRRDGRRDPRDVLEPAVLRLPGVRGRAAGVLGPLDDGLGAPHVHLRPDHEQVLLAHLDGADRARRHRVLRLPRHDLEGQRCGSRPRSCSRSRSSSSSWSAA